MELIGGVIVDGALRRDALPAPLSGTTEMLLAELADPALSQPERVTRFLAAIINCILFVAAPAAVAEKLGPFAALARSAELTKDRRWGIFGLTFLLGLALIAVIIVWAIPVFSGAASPDELRLAALGIVGSLGVLQMFTGIVEAVSYVLLRGDKDGMTYDQLGRVFD